LSELQKKKDIVEICLFQGHIPVSPVVFYIAMDDCTLVTKSEFSRNLCEVKKCAFCEWRLLQ